MDFTSRWLAPPSSSAAAVGGLASAEAPGAVASVQTKREQKLAAVRLKNAPKRPLTRQRPPIICFSWGEATYTMAARSNKQCPCDMGSSAAVKAQHFAIMRDITVKARAALNWDMRFLPDPQGRWKAGRGRINHVGRSADMQAGFSQRWVEELDWAGGYGNQ